MTEPVIIEVAVNGATSKTQNPFVPVTPAEVAEDAVSLLNRGAAIIHNHPHDMHLVGEVAASAYGDSWAPILAEHPEAILCPTFALGPTAEDKVAHIGPCATRGARMAPLDPGSVNLADTAEEGSPGRRRFAYVNDFNAIDAALLATTQAGLASSIAIYEPGFLRATLAYHRAGRIPKGSIVKLYFGGDYDFIGRGLSGRAGRPAVGFGLPPTNAALTAYLEMLEGSGLSWSVAVLGGDVVRTGLARLALERGGHLRVGLEDYGGTDTPTNAQLLEAAVAVCRAVGRPLASSAEAADLLGMM